MNFYRKRYASIKKAIKTLHWNETDGIWYDYDLERKVKFYDYIPETFLLFIGTF